MTKEKIKRGLADACGGLLSGTRSLGNMTADAARKARKTIADAVSGIRIRAEIYREENKLRESETELGRLYYGSCVSGCLPDSEKKETLFAEIGANKKSIAALRTKLSRHRAETDGEGEAFPDDVTDDDLVLFEEA